MDDAIVKATNIDDRAVAAKQSNAKADSLIGDFHPFIQSLASSYSLQYQDVHHDEVQSVIMEAFYEAIQGYDARRGHFFPFARQVIRARTIDHIRSVSKHREQTVPLEENRSSQQSAQSANLSEVSERQYNDWMEGNLLQDEIAQFEAELETWGITLATLSKQSPKHKKLRDSYRMVIRQIADDPDILHTIQMKRYFPVKAIAQITGLPPKKLERARTFILASLIIKMGDYEYLSEYIAN